MGCGKSAAEKYHRVNLICPRLKLCAGCADALTAAAADNPVSTGLCVICGINPPMSDDDRKMLDRIAPLAAARVESLKLRQDCGIVAAMLRAAMQSDNAAILPRPIAIAFESLSKLAAEGSDRYCADCAAPGCHLHLMSRVDRYARDNQCHWCYRKIVPMVIAALPPGVTAPGEVPGRMVKVRSVYNIVNRPSKILQNRPAQQILQNRRMR